MNFSGNGRRNRIDSEDDLNTFINSMLLSEAAIIIRIVSGKVLKKLWEHTKNQLQHGQTYSNEKLAPRILLFLKCRTRYHSEKLKQT